MKFLQAIRTMIALMPVIVEAIKVVEQLIPGDGKGEQKLRLVRGMIESAYTQAEDTMDDFNVLWPMLAKQITLIIEAFNDIGIFKKGAEEDDQS